MPELKLTSRELATREIWMDTAVELSLETECLLPDYEPEVFRIVKALARPVLERTSVNGDRIQLDGSCQLSILYLGAQPGDLRAVRQKLPFSKTVELSQSAQDNTFVECNARMSFVNARAVSSRRLEVRCGISLRTRVTAEKKYPVVIAAEGMGVQLHRKELSASLPHREAEKNFTISEDLMLGQAKPPFGSLLDAEYHLSCTDRKIMEERMIVRGDLTTRILYCPEGGGEPERMEWSEPVSQLLDIPGLSEDDSCDVYPTQIDANFEPIREDGGCRRLSAEWNITLRACCDRNETFEAADDGYSCRYPAETDIRSVPLPRVLGTIRQTIDAEGTAKIGSIEKLFAVLPSLGEYSCRSEGEKLILSGTVETVILYEADGTISSADKTVLFETPFEVEGKNMSFFPAISILSADGTVREDGIALQIRLMASGNVYESGEEKLLCGMVTNEETPFLLSGAAIRICYAEPNESLWEIAKRSHVPLEAMMNENGLTGERTSRQMLLIPMVTE